MRRSRMSSHSSKSSFRGGAARVHPKNLNSGSSFVSRGGIRL